MGINNIFYEIEVFLKNQYPKVQHPTFDVDDYTYLYGRTSEALLYSTLFMPELVVIDESVLLKNRVDSEELFSQFVEAKNKWSLEKAECAFNFIEVGYLFSHNEGLGDREDEILAQRIRDSWDGWLKVQFPDRVFVVEVLSPEVTGSTVGVHFYQQRD